MVVVSTVGRRLLGPKELTWMDRGVQALAGTGLAAAMQSVDAGSGRHLQ